jgi:hypothetical protein
MKNQFTPALLSGVNGVSYDVKRLNYSCDFVPDVSLSLGFYPDPDLNTLTIFSAVV